MPRTSVFLGLFLMAVPLTGRAADEIKNVAAVSERVESNVANLIDLYTSLHSHPELSLKEEKSAARMAKEARAAGFEVTEKVGGTGVVAVLKNRSEERRVGKECA